MSSRRKTADEVRDEFLSCVRAVASYWATLPGEHTPQDRCDGVAMGILSLIDGVASLPAMTLTVDPADGDKEYDIERGQDWYEPGTAFNTDCYLHDLYFHPNVAASRSSSDDGSGTDAGSA
jgi:hypothetical protein